MKKQKTSLILLMTILLTGISVILSGCNKSSGSSSGGLGIFGYIVAIGLIIGGLVAIVADGKKHGVVYVIGEIIVVILLVTFG